MPNNFIYFLDFLLLPIYLLLLSCLALFFRSYYKRKGVNITYFMLAFYCRIIGGLLNGILVKIYFKSGDTIGYFYEGSKIASEIINQPNTFFDWFLGNLHNYETINVFFAVNDSNFLTVKFTAFWELFTFQTYLPTCAIFAFFSFLSCWHLYTKIIFIYPNQKKEMALAFLFLPGLIYWGAVISKDAICITCLSLLITSVINVFILKKKIVISLVTLVISSYILSIIKVYIVLALYPSLFFWSLMIYKDKLKNKIWKKVFTPIVLLLAFSLGYGFIYFIGTIFDEYSLSNIVESGLLLQEKIDSLGGNSTYHLDFDLSSPTGVLYLILQSINVTLFRPYIWELNNILMVFAFIESFSFLLFTLYLIKKFRFTDIIFTISTDTNIQFFLIFAIVFSFSVGAVSNNFGTLIRYKIPCTPFYLASLFLIKASLEAKIKK